MSIREAATTNVPLALPESWHPGHRILSYVIYAEADTFMYGASWPRLSVLVSAC